VSPEDAASAQRQLQTRLREVPLFARCHPDDLRVVAKRCDLREVPDNTLLIRAGDLADEFFVLISGSAERGIPGEPVRKYGPGDYFGELAVLDPAPRSLDVYTTSKCVVGVLSRSSFLLVLDAVPGVSSQLLASLAHRLREADLREDHELT
jgi:CRP-like cAMP-binding protein